MSIKRVLILLSSISLIMLMASCTEDQNPSKIEEKVNKITGTILSEDASPEEGAIVQLKVANYNPIVNAARNYDKVNCRGLSEDPEILEFETTTDKNGNYCFTDVPNGVYALSAKDSKNKKAVYKPNIKISDKDSIIGNDTLQGYVEITIHVPNSYVSENSFFYIPGTDIYFHISKAGTMYIQVPVGLISLVFCKDSDLFLETLFLIIKNLLINDTTVIDTHQISTPEFMISDTSGVFSTDDTLMFYIRVNSTQDHPIQYRIMWEDSIWSDWSYESKNIPKVFSYPGHYTLFAQARCGIDTTIISDISNPIYLTITDSVVVPNEWITAPQFLSGSHFANIGDYKEYFAGHAYSNVTSEFEYQFTWGDGDTSEWISDTLIYMPMDCVSIDSMWDTTNEMNGVILYHQWNRKGAFDVRVRARSAFNYHLVSDWSHGLHVNVNDSISSELPTPFVWGPSYLQTNESGSFSISVDGLGDSTWVRCIIDWGDSSYFDWTGYAKDSVAYNVNHTYYRAGIYLVKAQLIQSIEGLDSTITSAWSDPFYVEVLDTGIIDTGVIIDTIITDTMIIDTGIIIDTIITDTMIIDTGIIIDTIITDTMIIDTGIIIDTIITDTMIIDTGIIIDTIITDTMIIDTGIIIDTIIGDTSIVIDTIFTDTTLFDTLYLKR